MMIMIKQKSISKEDEMTTVKNLSFIHSVTLNIIKNILFYFKVRFNK